MKGTRERKKGKYWGMILAKVYCFIVFMYKYVTINPTIMHNYNAPIKNMEKFP